MSSFLIKLLFFFSCLIILCACSNTRVVLEGTKRVLGNDNEKTVQDVSNSKKIAKGHYKVGKPYIIKNILYTPRLVNVYDKVGIASWYGPNFDGKPTANGEIFDQDKISAAHKTLPLPSIVKVTNLNNNNFLFIRVNDRGPFVNDRIIDLSKQAAIKLNTFKKGTENVRVILIDTGPHLLDEKFLDQNYVKKHAEIILKNKKQIASKKKVYFQLGVFRNLDNAKNFIKNIKNKLPFEGNYEISEQTGENIFFKILFGPFTEKILAKNIADKLSELGYNYIIINKEG